MHSETFLRRVLWADAATCAAFAILMAIAGDPLESLLGIPRAVHLVALALLVPSALLMAFTASRKPLFAAGVILIVCGNAAWVLASFWLALSGVFAPTGPGIAFLMVQAAAVAAIAMLEYSALRQTRRNLAA